MGTKPADKQKVPADKMTTAPVEYVEPKAHAEIEVIKKTDDNEISTEMKLVKKSDDKKKMPEEPEIVKKPHDEKKESTELEVIQKLDKKKIATVENKTVKQSE